MRPRQEGQGRHQLSRARRLFFATLALGCALGFQAGCANDPVSQKRIATRRAHIQQTIQAMADHETAAAGRMRYQIRRIGKWYKEDQVKFRERIRTAGNNIW